MGLTPPRDATLPLGSSSVLCLLFFLPIHLAKAVSLLAR